MEPPPTDFGAVVTLFFLIPQHFCVVFWAVWSGWFGDVAPDIVRRLVSHRFESSVEWSSSSNTHPVLPCKVPRARWPAASAEARRVQNGRYSVRIFNSLRTPVASATVVWNQSHPNHNGPWRSAALLRPTPPGAPRLIPKWVRGFCEVVNGGFLRLATVDCIKKLTRFTPAHGGAGNSRCFSFRTSSTCERVAVFIVLCTLLLPSSCNTTNRCLIDTLFLGTCCHFSLILLCFLPVCVQAAYRISILPCPCVMHGKNKVFGISYLPILQ